MTPKASRQQGANIFEDLSGNPTSHSSNPYDSLIEGCQNEPVSPIHSTRLQMFSHLHQKQIQLRYQTHRTTRNSQQKAKFFSPDFSGFNIDPVLHKLVHKSQYPGFEDPRNCLVFWARPPQHLRNLIEKIQEQLLEIMPSESSSDVLCEVTPLIRVLLYLFS